MIAPLQPENLSKQTASIREQSSRSSNMLIEGDNLPVLAMLPSESIDLIYTDPPYNTGKKFRYNDSWKGYGRTEEMYVTEDIGDHASWITFMASRLRLMKPLLKPSGVIAISIGKEEFFRLGMLTDDLFGEDNCLGIINWQKKYAPSNDSKHLADATEYVLIYRKEWQPVQRTIRSSENLISLWGRDDPCFDENRLRIGDVPLLAFPPSWYDSPFELGCQSWRYHQSGHTQDATRLLNAIMGHHGFATPKPLKLIEKIIQLWCPLGSVVLDPFAGSGTTGHAVLDLNARLGVRRTFVLIEQGNPSTADLFARTLTAERLRRVLTGEWAAGKHAPLSGGFTFVEEPLRASDRGLERGVA